MTRPALPAPVDEWQAALVKELEEFFISTEGALEGLNLFFSNELGNSRAQIIEYINVQTTDLFAKIEDYRLLQVNFDTELTKAQAKLETLNTLYADAEKARVTSLKLLEAKIEDANNKSEARVTEFFEAYSSLEVAMGRWVVEVNSTLTTAISDASAAASLALTTFASGYESLATFQVALTAAYEGYADGAAEDAQANAIATANSALTAFASGHSSLAAFETNLTAGYQTYADTAAGQAQTNAEATAASELSAFAGPYTSMANYNTTVTSAYQSFANNAANNAETNAEATAATALSTFSSGHSTLAAFETSLTTTYDGRYSSLIVFGELQDDVDAVELKFGVTGTIDGVSGGFIFTGIQTLGGGVTYDLIIDANVTINGNLLVNGTITTLKAATHAFTETWAATGANKGPLTFPSGTVIVSMTCDIQIGTDVLVEFDCDATLHKDNGTEEHSFVLLFQIEGVTIFTRAYRSNAYGGNSKIRYPLTFKRRITTTPGSKVFRLVVNGNQFHNVKSSLRAPTLIVTELKR